MEAWGMFLAVRRSDASERTVVLPDPMEPVIRSAVIGDIGDLVFGTGYFRSVVPPGLELPLPQTLRI
jgi:hypothetical protein